MKKITRQKFIKKSVQIGGGVLAGGLLGCDTPYSLFERLDSSGGECNEN